MISMRNWVAGILLTALASGQALAADAAAKVVMLTGQATAVDGEGAVRQLAKDDAVYSGDFVNSGPGSYVNLHFADGAFFLLRPNTRFQIEDYHYADPASKAAAAEIEPAAVPTPAPAPAAVAKTVFNAPTQEDVAQACSTSQACRDCRASGSKPSKACNICYTRVKNCKAVKKAFLAGQKSGAAQTATTAPTTPAPSATAAPAPTAPASPAAAPVVTASSESEGETSRAFFRLVKGGFRSVSGLIGKVNQDDYRVSTPVATIGIRGTRYGARLCQGDCADWGEIVTKLRAAGRNAKPGETVLVTTVEEGKIAIETKTMQDLQIPDGGARLVDKSGAISKSDTPPTTERLDQDMNPESCTP